MIGKPMGITNVSRVYEEWPDLPHLAFRVLVYMAKVSLDEGKEGNDPRQFWEGWRALAAAAGVRDVPPDDDESPAAKKMRRNARAVHDRAISELVKRGAVQVVKKAAPGRNAKYALNLSPATRHGERGTSTNHEDRGTSEARRATVAGATRHGERGQRATVSVTTCHGEGGAEEYEEQVRKKKEQSRAREAMPSAATAGSELLQEHIAGYLKPPPHEVLAGISRNIESLLAQDFTPDHIRQGLAQLRERRGKAGPGLLLTLVHELAEGEARYPKGWPTGWGPVPTPGERRGRDAWRSQ